MEKGLLEKTGKPLDHWLKVVAKAKIAGHKDIMDLLMTKHSFTYGFANFVALKARKADAASSDGEELVDAQYKGKEPLRPIYAKLIEKIGRLGTDITTTPKKDSVSLIRKKQFVLIKPATKARIDVGLKLTGKPFKGRLKNSGPFGSMCTHRVQITSIDQVDKELVGWIDEAYKAAG